MTKLKTILLTAAAVYVLAVTGAAAWLGLSLRRSRAEAARLSENQETLLSDIRTYRTRDGRQAAEVKRLQMTVDEYRSALESSEGVCASQKRVISSLNLKLRRLESVQQTTTVMSVDTVADYVPEPFFRDTLPHLTAVSETPVSPVGAVEWSDPWVSVRVRVGADGKAAVNVTSVDTLYQVVHRVPRRFLGIPFGTRGIRQDVTSSNPHSRVVYAEYIELGRK